MRKELLQLLKGEHAHASVESAIEGLTTEVCNTRLPGMAHTIWELFEHLRLAQEDILRYTLDPAWQSPPFPQGYWPTEPATEAALRQSLSAFFADLEEAMRLVEDERIDLTAVLPHAGEHTYLREILLIADHNAYHLGQIIQLRKAIGGWPKDAPPAQPA